MTFRYDPPGGWRYGFPKVYRPIEGETLEDTLIRDGYPEKLAHEVGQHCRFIGDAEELDAMDANTAARHHVEHGPDDLATTTFGPLSSYSPADAWRDGVGLIANDNVRQVAETATGRKGDFMQLYSGKIFYPMDPRADEVEIEDIAHALSMQCRYAGHCLRFYSVAEHCVHLARHVSGPNKLWALLHDASEAYLVDVPRPVKPYLEGYKAAERRVMDAVCDRFGLPREMPAEVHAADSAIIGDERANMSKCVAVWSGDYPGIGAQLGYWSPQWAEFEFIDMFRTLIRQRQEQARAAA